MDWQPIETAPKDGTPVLLYGEWAGEIWGVFDEPSMEVGLYAGSGDYARQGFLWAATGGDAYATWCKPSHWMPLPAPPKPLP